MKLDVAAAVALAVCLAIVALPTFLLPPHDPRADYRVRIFTPTQELPFAGHPTLGSGHSWLTAGATPRGADEISVDERTGDRP